MVEVHKVFLQTLYTNPPVSVSGAAQPLGFVVAWASVGILYTFFTQISRKMSDIKGVKFVSH